MTTRVSRAAAAAALALALCAAAELARAQESAAFLKIGVGARAMSMGNAFTAVADDSDALYWNPGGLALLERPEISATRAMMFLGDTYDTFSAAVPLGSRKVRHRKDLKSWKGHTTATAIYSGEATRGVIGFGFTRLSQSEQQGRDADRRPTGSFDASDMALSVAYARRLGKLHGGVAIKRIQSRIADASASTFAADFGAIYPISRNLRMGASIRNLGQGLTYAQETSPLPLVAAFGASYRLRSGFVVSGEIKHRPNASKTSFSIGTEYAIMSAVSLRAGYLHQGASAGSTAGVMGGLGGGVGVKWGRFRFDYSLSPFGELGNIQRLSVRFRF